MTVDAEIRELRNRAAGSRAGSDVRAYTLWLFRSGQGWFLYGPDSTKPCRWGSVRVCWTYRDQARQGDAYEDGSCTSRLVGVLDLEHLVELVTGGFHETVFDLATLKHAAFGGWRRAEEIFVSREPRRGGLTGVRLLVPGEECPQCLGEKTVTDISVVPHWPGKRCPTCEATGLVGSID